MSSVVLSDRFNIVILVQLQGIDRVVDGIMDTRADTTCVNCRHIVLAGTARELVDLCLDLLQDIVVHCSFGLLLRGATADRLHLGLRVTGRSLKLFDFLLKVSDCLLLLAHLFYHLDQHTLVLALHLLLNTKSLDQVRLCLRNRQVLRLVE